MDPVKSPSPTRLGPVGAGGLGGAAECVGACVLGRWVAAGGAWVWVAADVALGCPDAVLAWAEELGDALRLAAGLVTPADAAASPSEAATADAAGSAVLPCAGLDVTRYVAPPPTRRRTTAAAAAQRGLTPRRRGRRRFPRWPADGGWPAGPTPR